MELETIHNARKSAEMDLATSLTEGRPMVQDDLTNQENSAMPTLLERIAAELFNLQ